MQLRLLFATPEAEFLKVFASVIASALELAPIQVAMTAVATRQQLFQRVESGEDDIVVMHRAMGREAKQRAAFAASKQMPVLDANSCCITDAAAGG